MRKINDETFLTYLLQYPKVNELKDICRDFQIKGYSKFKKDELIKFIISSLSDNEMSILIEDKEPKIINDGFTKAIKKIKGMDMEKLESVLVKNTEDGKEVNIKLKGMKWITTSFMEMSPPEDGKPRDETGTMWDCDCKIGSNNGFCPHFWICFMALLKQGTFDLEDWTLTVLPDDFLNKYNSIKARL